MNRQNLIDKIADATGLTKKGSGDALDATLNAIADALAEGEKVSLVGFGTFEARARAARRRRIPRLPKVTAACP